MNILTIGTTILAVGVTETGDNIASSDAIYPKHVIPGWQIIEAELPNDYAPGKYCYENGFVLIPPSAEEAAAFIAQRQTDTTNAIQDMLDTKAQEYRYDSIHTACGWAPALADAVALKAWGAACWLKAGEIEAEVIAGTRPLPTVLEVLAEMPEFVI